MAIGENTLRDGIQPVDHPLPPGQDVLQKVTPFDQEAPAHSAGSFFVDGESVIGQGRKYPVDPETGQPYLIVPVEIESDKTWAQMPTYHHFRYYKRDLHLGGGTKVAAEKLPFRVLAGLSARVVTGQYLSRILHKQIHDKRFPLGPELSTKTDDKFYNVTASIAGIVPRQVLDLTKPEGHELVDVEGGVFNQIASMKQVGIERFRSPLPKRQAANVLSVFLLRYAATQDIWHLAGEIERYRNLSETDMDRRILLGRKLLTAGIEVAMDPLLPVFADFRRRGYIQPGKTDALTEVKAIALRGDVSAALSNLDMHLNGYRAVRALREIDKQGSVG